MKNKAIELMIRSQYNLEDDTQVDVLFLYSQDGTYTFNVTDYTRHSGSEISIRNTLISVRYDSNIDIVEG